VRDVPQTGDVADTVKRLRCMRRKVKLCKPLLIILKEQKTEISAVGIAPFECLMGKSATT
jgi:hypothetical protein